MITTTIMVINDDEMNNFLKIWLTAIATTLYTYYIASKLPKGIPRLISLLPILYLYTNLPLHLTSTHLGGPTTFYLLWLANFKLLLFAFNKPPLAPPSSLSLLHFISISLLPIQKTTTTTTTNHTTAPNLPLYAIKVLLLAIIVKSYQITQNSPYITQLLYCIHIYLGVELVLFITAVPVRAILGVEIEKQFDEPYLATSLQDFWGRRWNLMVSSILRPTVYSPVKGVCTRVLGRVWWSRALAVMATFVVSGLMHEVIYYYLTRVAPTWEVTWFFVLHGVCTAGEVAVKEMVGGRWRVNRVASRVVTLGFVAATGVWLFFPQIVRNGVDKRAIVEYSILVDFLKERLRRVF